jgi:hypothetical protein
VFDIESESRSPPRVAINDQNCKNWPILPLQYSTLTITKIIDPLTSPKYPAIVQIFRLFCLLPPSQLLPIVGHCLRSHRRPISVSGTQMIQCNGSTSPFLHNSRLTITGNSSGVNIPSTILDIQLLKVSMQAHNPFFISSSSVNLHLDAFRTCGH